MLFPQKMLQVKVHIPKDTLSQEILGIGRSGVLHVNRAHKNIFFANIQSRVHILLQSIHKYMDTLSITQRESFKNTLESFEDEIETAKVFLDEIGLAIEAISNVKKRIDTDLEEIELAKKIEASIDDIDISASLHVKMLTPKVVVIAEEFFEFFQLSTQKLPLFYLFANLSKGTKALVLYYDKSCEKSLNEIVSKIEAKSVDLHYFELSFREEVANEKEALGVKEKRLLASYQDRMISTEATLGAIYKLLDVESLLLSVEDGFILQGWIPKKEKQNFQKELGASTVDFIDAKSVAPVLLKTPRLFKPFEELIENFSYPNYTEVNPTVIFAFTFLAMFGMMFGDIGHGSVLIATGYGILRYAKQYKTVARIMLSTGISSVFFGAIYGSIFGFHVLPFYVLSPMENITNLLYIGLFAGIFIITMGMVLNIFSTFKKRNFYKLFFGSGGILWLLVYWFMIGIAIKVAIYKLSVTIEVYAVMGILLILFLMFLYKSKNIIQTFIQTAIEVMEYATNTISFIRLGAFTLSHAALFLALFSIADLISKNTQSGLGYWLTMIIGNIIIIVLEGVIVAIQTLRLEYYEFFKRFYSGGGEKYQPFTIKEDEDETYLHV